MCFMDSVCSRFMSWCMMGRLLLTYVYVSVRSVWRRLVRCIVVRIIRNTPLVTLLMVKCTNIQMYDDMALAMEDDVTMKKLQLYIWSEPEEFNKMRGLIDVAGFCKLIKSANLYIEYEMTDNMYLDAPISSVDAPISSISTRKGSIFIDIPNRRVYHGPRDSSGLAQFDEKNYVSLVWNNINLRDVVNIQDTDDLLGFSPEFSIVYDTVSELP
jgi:hypothetical protein